MATELRHLKARYLFPIASEPIADGILTLEGPRIVSVGTERPDGPVEDLGNVAILPGLVNAHTHLEFSSLRQPLGTAGQAMPDWIRAVLQWRQGATVSREEAIAEGLGECAKQGVTTLGEIAQADWPQSLFEEAPLHTTVFQELIGPTPSRVAAALERAERHCRLSLRESSAAFAERKATMHWAAGLSPHAPYTVRRELLGASVALSAARRVPLAFHLAESREEVELLEHQSGPLYEFLAGLAHWDASVLWGGVRPLDYLRQLAPAHRVLVIHGNYLADEEIAFLAEHVATMSVVYCPRTHAFFRHADYPLARMLAAGVRVCLGTDSRATAPDLSLLAEMREAARRHPTVAPSTILRLGTLDGALALGRDHEVGTLEPGKWADLAVVALPEAEADPYTLLLQATTPVVGAWFRGQAIPGVNAWARQS